MAAQLCLPSPACVGKIGEPVGQGGAVVDLFGDAVVCARLPFDTWRHKHDDIKLALVERAHHAHIDCDAEVFGLFRHLIPGPAVATQPGGELDTGRARSGKIPDLRYRLPKPPGPNDRNGNPRLLAELKVINVGPTRYPIGNDTMAVDTGKHGLFQENTGEPWASFSFFDNFL